ncbi:MAG: hypothetical protein ACYTDY_02135 [Planctomycetota bacterium]|jgi:hypothetical protein
MRTAWAVLCLIATIVVAHWMFFRAGLPQEGIVIPLSGLLKLNAPHALGILAVSLLLAAAAGRIGAAARVAVALAVLSLLVTLSHVFWSIAAVRDPEVAPPVDRALAEFFISPIWAVALGGLFFEALRRRAARKEGAPAEPVIGDAWVLLCVPLAGLVILLVVVRF